MEEKFSFKRYFLIFRQEDPGFGTGREPSGHIKIEVKGGRGKAQVELQNITKLKENKSYKVYLLGFAGGKVFHALAGSPEVKSNRGELVWEFDASDVSGTGRNIGSFDTAVVLAETIGKDFAAIECPMAAYKGQKTVWREKFREAMRSSCNGNDIKNSDMDAESGEVYSKYDGKMESVYKPYFADMGSSIKDTVPKEMPEEKFLDESIENKFEEELENDMTAGYAEDLHSGDIHAPAQEYAYPGNTAAPGMLPGFQCPLQQGVGCNGCTACSGMENRADMGEVRKKPGADMEMLKKYMSRYFEQTEPFRIKRREYKWWKVGSPPQLNNLLFQCNIRSPILFNPKVISAHFKYRHIIAGIYTDFRSRREYLVCGIPGVYELDEKPFGELCRWVQVEGYRPKYGAFGYWIAYVDPATGKLMELK